MDITLLLSQLQGIAQTGLHYCKDEYDRERYEQLNSITINLLKALSTEPTEKIYKFFSEDTGYATPKVDIRAVVFDENKNLLLVKEAADNKWSLPGGWADIGFSAKEIAEKEVFEEAGISVKAQELIAIVDKQKHNYPLAIEHAYKMFILCSILSMELATGIETLDAKFMAKDEIEKISLSLERTIPEDIERAFAFISSDNSRYLYFD